MMQREGICSVCNKFKKGVRYSETCEADICNWCYRKNIWKPKLTPCKRCGRERPNHALGFCNGCYNSLFQIENVKKWNAKLYHNIDPALYKRATSTCIICGFDKIVDLHHVNLNHKDNSEGNLVGLCPNHHKMIHHRDFRQEVFKILEEKGFKTPEIYKDDAYYKSLAEPSIHKNRFKPPSENI